MIGVYEKVHHNRWCTYFFNLKTIAVMAIVIKIMVSCTKEIQIDIQNFNRQLVVNSVFNTEKPFTFNFSYPTAVLEMYEDIKDKIHFELYADNILILDTVLTSAELHTNVIPKPNIKYSIKIRANNTDQIFSSDSIPQLVEIDEALIKHHVGVDSYGDEYSEAIVTFTDPPDDSNYYELLIYNMYDNKITGYWQISEDTDITDFVLLNEGNMNYLPTSYFFTDELFNGRQYTMYIRSLGREATVVNGVALRSVSKNYYLYRKIYTRHAYCQQFQGDSFNKLFKGEPQNMFSNIENGYGIFAGYRETSKVLQVIE
jgi:hypothetical protein